MKSLPFLSSSSIFNRRRRLLYTILTILLGLNWLVGQDDELRIGYILDFPPGRELPFFDQITGEIETLLGSEYDLPLDERQVKYTSWDHVEINRQLEAFLEDPSIHMIIGVGTLCSEVMARRTEYPKPVIASVIIDPHMQDIPISKKGTSTVKNFAFVLSPFSVQRDLEQFYELYPFRRLAVLVQQDLLHEISSMRAHFQDYFEKAGVDYGLIPVSETVDGLETSLQDGYDAVYIGPVFSLRSREEFERLISIINDEGLPSFALVGAEACRAGVLASSALSSNTSRISRRIAINVQQLMDGKDADELPVRITEREQLYVNMATARQIAYYPRWDVLSKAVLLNEENEDIDRQISLLSAIREALDHNIELDMGKQDILAAEQDITIARSSLFPQFSISNFTRVIDEDRAASSFGSAPEWMSTLSGNVEQLLLSEPARTNRDIRGEQQQILIQAQSALEMDIVAESAEAYLNVLRAKTFLHIQRENLELSRKNLDIALVRQEVGYSGPSDVYRWESNIALGKTAAMQAESDMRKAEMQLNQILNRPINEYFRTEEVSLADNYIITNDERIFPYISAADIFDKFSDFMVEEGMRNLPELAQVESGIRINERILQSDERSLYTPSIGMLAAVDQNYLKEGAGSDGGDLMIPGLSPPDNINWTIGLQASLPIYSGRKRLASIQKSKILLERSLYEKNHFVRLFEQRIRNELEESAASYTSIDLRFEARDAAQKNLSLVQDSYAKGVVSIIQLIDAQNAAIQAELGAANSIYEFVLDLIRLERSIGHFYTLSTKEERDGFFSRLEAFINTK